MKNSWHKLLTALILSIFLTSALSSCGYKSYKEKGMWQDFPGIFTAVEATDLELYREILPKQFDMPERPVVAMFIVDYVIVVPLPMVPYLEGAVALSCKYKGEDTWHVVTMPVTDKVACKGGRSLGFPKYVADEIILQKDGDGWKAKVVHEGVTRMGLEFTPGLTRELKPLEKEVMEGPISRLEGAIYQLSPPEVGPAINKISLVPVVPANWETERGMVKITISPEDPWSGLIPAGTVSPGSYQRFTGGNNMVSKKAN
jgi:Acetoacetate decarboxylase (ADC)